MAPGNASSAAYPFSCPKKTPSPLTSEALSPRRSVGTDPHASTGSRSQGSRLVGAPPLAAVASVNENEGVDPGLGSLYRGFVKLAPALIRVCACSPTLVLGPICRERFTVAQDQLLGIACEVAGRPDLRAADRMDA